MKRGFTLIELLMVIGIIAILSSIVGAGYSSAKQKSRDAARISNVTQVELALEAYFQAQPRQPSSAKVYPTNLSDLVPTYISELPKDPSTGAPLYSYIKYVNAGDTDNNGKQYCLGVVLENQTHEAIAKNTQKCASDTDSWCTLTYATYGTAGTPGTQYNYKICR
jgi:prepilin-type N-terminal cleavage/methylation domain-containing protein